MCLENTDQAESTAPSAAAAGPMWASEDTTLMVPDSFSKDRTTDLPTCLAGPSTCADDDLECDGGGDWHRRCVLQGSRLRVWLGLMPRQISTGNRTSLGKISTRGNRNPTDQIKPLATHGRTIH
jgi:hypothetical protein